jgi:UDP-glucose 4-epimerase
MILITGGAGYIGSHTNKVLNKRGYRTLVFDNLVSGHQSSVRWGDFILGDLANIDQLRLCFQKNTIEAVIHFAGFAYVGESVINPAIYYRNNVSNTINLLDIMVEFGVKNIIFSSTCATYGIPHELPITEEHPQNPINPYGSSKLVIEKILDDYDMAYGVKHVNLRYFNAAGADPEGEIGEQHDPETHLIPLILNTAAGNSPYITIYGTNYDTSDGTCIRDYIHVTDLSDAHVLALEYIQETKTSISLNLGNEQGTSVREIVEIAESVSKNNIRIIEGERRIGDPPVLIGSSQKAKTLLNWCPKLTNIETIIESAWSWQNSKC